MENKLKDFVKKPLAAVILTGLVSPVAQALPYTIGQLTYDEDVNPDVVVDTLNNREWLRWDVLSGWTYGQTLGLITFSPTFSDWNIANHEDAHDFLDALVPDVSGNSCQVTSTSNEGCWTDDATLRSYNFLLGDSYVPGDSYDSIFFEGEDPGRVGMIQFERKGSLITTSRDPSLTNTLTADLYSLNYNIGWLLYRDLPTTVTPPAPPSVVTEPSGLGLLGISMLGLAYARRRKDAK